MFLWVFRISPSLHQSTMISPRDGKMTRQRTLVHSCIYYPVSKFRIWFSTYDPSNFGGINTFVICIPCTCMIPRYLSIRHFLFTCFLAHLICMTGFCRFRGSKWFRMYSLLVRLQGNSGGFQSYGYWYSQLCMN